MHHKTGTATAIRMAGRSVRRRGLAGTAIAVSVVVLAACGSDGSPTASVEQNDGALTKTEFIAQADEICDEYGKEFDAVPLPQGNPAAPHVSDKVLDQTARAARDLAAIEREMAAELRALTPPDNFASRFDAALDALEERVEHFENLSIAAEQRDRQAVAREFRAADAAGTKGRKEVAGYGFKICGVG